MAGVRNLRSLGTLWSSLLWSTHCGPGSGNDLATGPCGRAGAGVQACPLLKVTRILRLTGPQLSPGVGAFSGPMSVESMKPGTQTVASSQNGQ